MPRKKKKEESCKGEHQFRVLRWWIEAEREDEDDYYSPPIARRYKVLIVCLKCGKVMLPIIEEKQNGKA